MKRFLLLFLFITISFKSFAQLDTEHWFAPMVDRVDASDNKQSLYLSTGETTAFKVDIYNNNAIVGSVVISKGNPQIFDITNREQIIVNGLASRTSLFTPVSKGLYLKGEKPFYASLRFSVRNHAEMIVSKGKNALGKAFRAAMAPISRDVQSGNGSVVNFMTGIMATEDNTHITISDFAANLRFSDNINRTSFNITLNKGQSYILDGLSFNTNNWTGFIGAKIVADKPISVTNGNFNGQYAITNQDSSDILMDQALPEDKLGDKFVLIKGFGANSYDSGSKTMEHAMIVAVKNNTAIKINGSLVATINEGDYYLTNPDVYVNQGSGHYNLFIETSEKSYVYQLFAGIETTSNADNLNGQGTGGFMSIPPLDACSFPKSIDEIGQINQNPFASNSVPAGQFTAPTTLNVIIKADATVLDIKKNGSPISLTSINGPFPVTGTSDWKTYSIPNIDGNISISSDEGFTAGLIAGNDYVGYGGYFGGFSSENKATIIQEGDCTTGPIKLKVPADLGTYQWLIKNPSTGLFEVISGATSNEYFPTNPGVYKVEYQKGVCPVISSEEFVYLACPINDNQDYLTECGAFTITPNFSLISQTVLGSSIVVTQNPTKGTVSIDPIARTLQYVPNATANGDDEFRYRFSGDDAVTPQVVEVLVKIKLNRVNVKLASLKACKVGTTGVYNLSLANVTDDAGITIEGYYKTRAGAENETLSEIISDFTAYNSTEASVFVRLKNTFGCIGIAEIELKFYPSIVLTPSAYNYTKCDTSFSGSIDVNLSDVTKAIVTNNAYFTNVRYYNSLADATAGTTPGLANAWSYSGDTTIYIRVESPDGCAPVIEALDFKVGATVPLLTGYYVDVICDDDFDGKVKIANLDSFKSYFNSDPNVHAKFYLNLADAENDVNGFTSYEVDQEEDFYVRLSHATLCPVLALLTIKVNIPEKSTVLEDKIICPEARETLDAGSGFIKYEWYNVNNPSALLGSGPSINLPVGKYFVILTAPNGCTYQQAVEIKGLELPTIESVEIQGQTITIIANGGTKPYMYSVDNGPYQTSNVFPNVQNGLHTANVISADDCAPVSKEFSIIKMYNVITPNGDGYNDVIDMSLLRYKTDAKFEVYDRFGKKVFEGTPSNNYIWTGKENGKPLETSSYWYILQWKDSASSPLMNFSGWILLKNRN